MVSLFRVRRIHALRPAAALGFLVGLLLIAPYSVAQLRIDPQATADLDFSSKPAVPASLLNAAGWNVRDDESLLPDSPDISLTGLPSSLTGESGRPFDITQEMHSVVFTVNGASDPSAAGVPQSGSTGTAAGLISTPAQPNPADTRIRWKLANKESLLSTGIMHTFNLWTEAGTRDAMTGPWLRDYLRSVSELRGWSDSDRFMAPYAGHPIQGSIFGFILRHNDPRYRDVQWGDGRDYFISLLRSMGYSAVWHTQWKIGPASEASIGNVMLHASPGFITLVDTPTLGTLTMLGEDAADRYVIMGLENRTANRPLILLTRCFLNPGRSFANLMAFKQPWNRDTRMGIFGENYLVRKQMVADYKNGTGEKPFVFERRPAEFAAPKPTEFPTAAPIELAAYPNYEHFSNGKNCIGGGGSGAARLSDELQIVAEVNGCLVMGMSNYEQSGDSLFYGAGPRWTPLATHRVSPFAQVLFGGRKVTYEVMDNALRTKLLDEWNDGSGTLQHYPKRSDYSTEVASNGASLAAGGGVDVVITRPFAWRLVNVEYTHSWMNGVENIRPENGVRITTEAVLRIGTW